MQDWRVFQQFTSVEEAEACMAILENSGILAMIEENNRTVDSILVGEDFYKNVQVKVQYEDFEKADKIMSQTAAASIADLDKDYYLFSFTDNELIEIVRKPDEWGKLDYILAGKLLAERGVDITEETQKSWHSKRMAELSRPENGLNNWALLGYACSLLGGFVAIVIGWALVSSKKTLPNGQIVYTYNERSRKQGKIIYYMGIFFTVLYSLLAMYRSYTM